MIVLTTTHRRRWHGEARRWNRSGVAPCGQTLHPTLISSFICPSSLHSHNKGIQGTKQTHQMTNSWTGEVHEKARVVLRCTCKNRWKHRSVVVRSPLSHFACSFRMQCFSTEPVGSRTRLMVQVLVLLQLAWKLMVDQTSPEQPLNPSWTRRQSS